SLDLLDFHSFPTRRSSDLEGASFKGILYAGLMIGAAGPKLIEFNVRFGDPECQVMMLRLMSDLVPALIAARDGMLKNFDLRWYRSEEHTSELQSRSDLVCR